MNIAGTSTSTHKEHNKINIHCVVQVHMPCQEREVDILRAGSGLKYCNLRVVAFQYDHYPGAIVYSSIGYSSWSGREEKGRQGY